MADIQKIETGQIVSDDQKKQIYSETPKKYIKSRKGRGGRRFDYVEGGYIVKRLNEIFNHLWDFEVVDKEIGKKQIYVQGKLTVYPHPQMRITKTQFGSAVIGKYSKGKKEGQIMDIGNDLKAAATDALKKCASLVGIASDIYWQGDTKGKEKSPDDCEIDHELLLVNKVKGGDNEGRNYVACDKCSYFRWRDDLEVGDTNKKKEKEDK